MIRTGVVLIGVGTIFLLKNLGYLDGVSFSLVWPTLLIIAGIALMIKPSYRCLGCSQKTWSSSCGDCSKKEETGGKKIA